MKLKIAFGIIVLNGDFFLRQILETIYPYAHAICIAEGPVRWHYEHGLSFSTDNTLSIIREFPDPEKKIKLVTGIWTEKTQQCQAWFNMVPEDTDYVFCNDADEVHTPENIEKIITYLQRVRPTSVGFRSNSFYGGFERIIGGFELEHSFKRVLKYRKGCYYRTHRQPTLAMPQNNEESFGRVLGSDRMEDYYDINGLDITGMRLYEETGIEMWHGSYISPQGVYNKIRYYEGAVISAGNCIPNYFNDVFMPWVQFPEKRQEIEDKWNGVQEFMPKARGECKTIPYHGIHPAIIQRDMSEFLKKFNNQLARFI